MERLTFEGNFCDIAQCRELREFTGLRQTKFGAEPVPITRPPQSWRYVEEDT